MLYGVSSSGKNAGRLSLPGGLVELKETAEQCAVREVQEELGIEIEVIDYLGSYASIYGDNRHTLNLVFIARHTSGEIHIGQNHDEYRWVKVKDFKPETLFEGGWLKGLQQYLSQL